MHTPTPPSLAHPLAIPSRGGTGGWGPLSSTPARPQAVAPLVLVPRPHVLGASGVQEKHHGGLCAQLCPLCPPHQEARLPPLPQMSSRSLQQCSSLRPLPRVQPPAHGRTSLLAPVSHHAAGGCRQSPPRGSPAPCHDQGTARSGAGVQLEEETAPGRASCAFIEGSPAMGTARAMGAGGRRGSGAAGSGAGGRGVQEDGRAGGQLAGGPASRQSTCRRRGSSRCRRCPPTT